MRSDLQEILLRHNNRVPEPRRVSSSTAADAERLAECLVGARRDAAKCPSPDQLGLVTDSLERLRSAIECQQDAVRAAQRLVYTLSCWEDTAFATLDTLRTGSRQIHEAVTTLRHLDGYLCTMIDAGGGHAAKLAVCREFFEVEDSEAALDGFRQTAFLELLELCSCPDFEDVKFGDDWLCVYVGDVVVRDPEGEYPSVDLGPFSLTLDLSNNSRTLSCMMSRAADRLYFNPNLLNVEALDPRWDCGGEYVHPHVSESGNPCLGDAEYPAARAMSSGRICDLFQLLKNWLNTYGRENPFCRIEDWLEGGRCCVCGGWLSLSDDTWPCAHSGGSAHRRCLRQHSDGRLYSPRYFARCTHCAAEGPQSWLGIGGMQGGPCRLCTSREAAICYAASQGIYQCWNCGARHTDLAQRTLLPGGAEVCSRCYRSGESLEVKVCVPSNDYPVPQDVLDQIPWTQFSNMRLPDPWRHLRRPPASVAQLVECNCGAKCLDSNLLSAFMCSGYTCPECDPGRTGFTPAMRGDLACLDAYLMFFYGVATSEFTQGYVETVGLRPRGLEASVALPAVIRLRKLEQSGLDICRQKFEDCFLGEKVFHWNQEAGFVWLRIKHGLPPEAVTMHDDMIAARTGRVPPHRGAADGGTRARERAEPEEASSEVEENEYWEYESEDDY